MQIKSEGDIARGDRGEMRTMSIIQNGGDHHVPLLLDPPSKQRMSDDKAIRSIKRLNNEDTIVSKRPNGSDNKKES